MGRVGRFILKVAAVLILIVSAGTFALSLFTGETRNGDNLQSEFDYLITVGISQSGEESSWKDANTCLLYTSPSPRDATLSRMPSSA